MAVRLPLPFRPGPPLPLAPSHRRTPLPAPRPMLAVCYYARAVEVAKHVVSESDRHLRMYMRVAGEVETQAAMCGRALQRRAENAKAGVETFADGQRRLFFSKEPFPPPPAAAADPPAPAGPTPEPLASPSASIGAELSAPIAPDALVQKHV